MATNGRYDEATAALRRYWDEVVQGQPTDPRDLDPALAATVRHLHARDDALGADPRFADRLLEELMATATTVAPAVAMPHVAPTTVGPNDHGGARAVRDPVHRPWVRQGRWALGQLATAALLVLTLGLGYVTLRVAGPDRQGRGLPAGVATTAATPASAAETTPLLRLTLTPPWMRGVSWQGIGRATYAPGAHTREASISSPQLCFVETGTFTVRSLEGEPPTRVADGTILSLPRTATPTVGGELRLSVGDALLLPAGSTVELHNDGDVQATILWLLSGPSNTTVENTGKITKNLTFTVVDRRGGDWANAPPMAVALDRVMLAPDGVLAGPGSGALVAVGAAQPLTYGQRSALRTEPGGSLQNTGAIPLDLYVLRVAAVQRASPAASTPSG
jgi:hypothetical protein